MTALAKARAYLASAPAEALSDVAGLVALCGLVLAGFVVPGLI